MVRDKFSANAIMTATLGGRHAKRGFSARQNYYATLNNTLKTQGCKVQEPDTMDVDAMRTSKLSREECDKLHKECKCFNCKKKGHLARDCCKKDSEGSSERKDKGKKPQFHVQSAKIEKVIDNCESEDKGPSASKEESPPSYEKKDDIVATIHCMTAEQKELALEQLAAEGF